MWLINTATLKLHEFIDAKHAPKYAILSHCWGQDEVSFKDYRERWRITGAGYKKIGGCCEFAKSRNQKWVWIDTCCIDKGSSAELSETINSMFSWYESAQECYAYLSDVTADGKDNEQIVKQFRKCRWFTRGWTLQELIAPKVLIFVTADWLIIGEKNAPGNPMSMYSRYSTATWLTKIVKDITGIPEEILCDEDRHELKKASAAQRMSWVSKRKTTREEDMAYCLFGLFYVNMPLLYGEGAAAFFRLQGEIMKRTGDESIFAWFPDGNRGQDMFAPSPKHFVHASNVVRAPQLHDRGTPAILGSEIQIQVQPGFQSSGAYQRAGSNHEYMLRLSCVRMPQAAGAPASPYILHLVAQRCGHYTRVFRQDVQVEDDIKSPEDWTLIDRAKTFTVHAHNHTLPCVGLGEITWRPCRLRLPGRTNGFQST